MNSGRIKLQRDLYLACFFLSRGDAAQPWKASSLLCRAAKLLRAHQSFYFPMALINWPDLLPLFGLPCHCFSSGTEMVAHKRRFNVAHWSEKGKDLPRDNE